MSERALSFPYNVTIEVSFRDLDAMGHVNNAVYFSYTLRG
jgi:acyl-CoA thioester hydrolase